MPTGESVWRRDEGRHATVDVGPNRLCDVLILLNSNLFKHKSTIHRVYTSLVSAAANISGYRFRIVISLTSVT